MRRFVMLVMMLIGFAAPTAGMCADPEGDRKEFLDFFKRRFPSVKFDDYAKGFIALPGMEAYKEQWAALDDMPPFEITVLQGLKLWQTPFANGKTFASCFRNGGKNIAQHYPYWHKETRRVRTAEMDLIDCMQKNDPALAAQFKNLGDSKVRERFAGLVGAFYSLSKGQRVSIDLSEPGARAAFAAGQKFWWSKRGQLNFACGDCHVLGAGKDIAAQPLSAALGHPVGWPAYRGSWLRLDIIHHRYKTCNEQVRAKPFEYFGEVYNNLQLYETYMSSGLPLTAPSYRGF